MSKIKPAAALIALAFLVLQGCVPETSSASSAGTDRRHARSRDCARGSLRAPDIRATTGRTAGQPAQPDMAVRVVLFFATGGAGLTVGSFVGTMRDLFAPLGGGQHDNHRFLDVLRKLSGWRAADR